MHEWESGFVHVSAPCTALPGASRLLIQLVGAEDLQRGACELRAAGQVAQEAPSIHRQDAVAPCRRVRDVCGVYGL